MTVWCVMCVEQGEFDRLVDVCATEALALESMELWDAAAKRCEERGCRPVAYVIVRWAVHQ